MRNFSRQALGVGIAIAAALALACGEAPSEPGARGPAPEARPAASTPAASHEPAAASADEAPSGTVYYRYLEPGGSVRFVARLDDVPAEERAGAKPIEMRMGSDLPHARAREAKAAPAKAPRQPWASASDSPAAAPRSQHEVVVYTTSWCPWCKKTLHWLDEKRVSYVNKDIEANPAWRTELVEKTGRASIPVVEIDGQQIRGFDQSAMERLL